MLIRDTHEQARELCCDVLFFYFKCEIFFFFFLNIKRKLRGLLGDPVAKTLLPTQEAQVQSLVGSHMLQLKTPHAAAKTRQSQINKYFLKGGAGRLVQIAFLVSLRSPGFFFCEAFRNTAACFLGFSVSSLFSQSC